MRMEWSELTDKQRWMLTKVVNAHIAVRATDTSNMADARFLLKHGLLHIKRQSVVETVFSSTYKGREFRSQQIRR